MKSMEHSGGGVALAEKESAGPPPEVKVEVVREASGSEGATGARRKLGWLATRRKSHRDKTVERGMAIIRELDESSTKLAARITTIDGDDHLKMTAAFIAAERRIAFAGGRQQMRREAWKVRAFVVAAIIVMIVWVAHRQGLDSPSQQPDQGPANNVTLYVSQALGLSAGFLIIAPFNSLPSIRRWRLRAPTVTRPVPLHLRRRELLTPAVFFEGVATILLPGSAVVELIKPRIDSGAFVGNMTLAVLLNLLVVLGAAGYLGLTKFTDAPANRLLRTPALEDLLPGCVRLLADAIELAPAWNRPDVSRYLINRLEATARTADAAAWQRRRVPLAEPRLRREARTDWLRLAAVIRAHKTAVGAARTRGDYNAVIASLTAGLTAMVAADWRLLLANAPTQVRTSRISTNWLTASLLPAVVLGTCAFALPYIPPFQSAGATATDGLRATLGLYALVTLLPRPGSMISLLGASMAKFGGS